MNKIQVLLIFLFSFVLANAQTPDFSLYGYAAMEGGTTGGEGGARVTPSTFAELQNYASATEPYIILIDREFKGPNVLRLGSNKTLLGVGDKAFINQIGVSIQSKHNIIIRNIRFTMTGVPISNDGENKIAGFNFDPDCIAIQADDESLPSAERVSHHIWVDHCEFYNEDPTVMLEYDRYDGLLDIKNDCQYITISWNYFHDHHKACLSGKGNSDNYDRKTTMHHNKFKNIKSRMPLLRYGKLHLLNNYFMDNPEGDGLNVRINSVAYVEKNYFENVKKPIFGKLTEGGKAHLVDNKFVNCGRLSKNHPSPDSPDADILSASEEYEDTDYVPPYSSQFFCFPVADVPAKVNKYAGIGVLVEEVDNNVAPTTVIAAPLNNAEFSLNELVSISVNAADKDGSITKVQLYVNDQLIDESTTVPHLFSWSSDVAGDFTIKAVAIDNKSKQGVSALVKVKILEASQNTDCHGDLDGNAYLDSCGVCVDGNTGFLPCVSTIQAENPCSILGLGLDSVNTGFTDLGYVNTDNVLGADVSWKLVLQDNLLVNASFYYANGGSSNRDASVIVNGKTNTSLSLPPTGSWTNWKMATVILGFYRGGNELILEAVSDEGLPNIDRLVFSHHVEKASCIITSVASSIDPIEISPNPTQGSVNFNGNYTYKLYNHLGQKLEEAKGSSIDLRAFDEGLYFIEIKGLKYKILKK